MAVPAFSTAHCSPIRLLPQLTIPIDQLDEALDILEAAATKTSA